MTKPRLSMLISYHYFRDVDLAALLDPWRDRLDIVMFADSGAFSAHSQNEVIEVKDYAAWLQRWPGVFTHYANLDVIGSAEATREHQASLEAMGLSPLPVFHCGDDFERDLIPLLGRYPYICLGGMVPWIKRHAIVVPWLSKCFDLAKGTGTRYHGLGLGTFDLLKMFPWGSSDASTGGAGFRYGKLDIFDPLRCHFFPAKMGEPEGIVRLADAIRYYGLEPEQFYNRTKNHYRFSSTLGQLSFYAAGMALGEAWPGYVFYHALPSENEVSWLLEDVTRFERAGGLGAALATLLQ